MRVSIIKVVALLHLVSQASAIYFADVFQAPTLQFERLERKHDEQIVVEIALVCDNDIGKMFNFNQTRISEYWEAVFWDVHLRYKTLKHINISFRITAIILLENAEQQPFIENVRNVKGEVPILEVYRGFRKWLYNQRRTMPTYDIGIAALGSDIEGTSQGYANLRGACLVDHVQQEVLSSLAVGMRCSDPAGVLAHEIGHVLGSLHDNEKDYLDSGCGGFDNTTEDQGLMGVGFNLFKNNGYYFSKCTNKAIVHFLSTLQARYCLDTASMYNPQNPPLINTDRISNSQPSTSISMDRQCQILFNDSHSQAYQRKELTDDSWCKAILCKLDLQDNRTKSMAYRPLDGTPCNGADKRCFRGSCMPPRLRLRNGRTGQCLGTVNQLPPQGRSVMQDCFSISNFPFDVINIKEVESNYVVIYVPATRNETFIQCLMLSQKLSEQEKEMVFIAKFDECTSSSSFRWEIIWLEINLGAKEFLLKNKETQLCLATVEFSNEIFGLAKCSQNNPHTRWRLLSENGSYINDDNLYDFIEKSKGNRHRTWFQFLFEIVLIPICCIKMVKFVFAKTGQLTSFLRNYLKKVEEGNSENEIIEVKQSEFP